MFPRRRFLQTSALFAASTLAPRAFGVPKLLDRAPRTVTSTLAGQRSVDGAGVHLERLIGQAALPQLDPFILLDRLHSNDPSQYIRGFPDHPHRGFETVTVMLEGHMRHRDSKGNHGDITGGGGQWMTAGRGIIHSEMPDQEAGWLSGFQLWVNLPASEKLCAPYYQDLQPRQLAQGRFSPAGSTVRLISGAAEGLHGPVRDRPTSPLLATVTLEDDRPWDLEVPRGHSAFVFTAAGELSVGDEPHATAVPEGVLAVLGDGARVRLRAPTQRSVALVAAGKPLREPVARRGPFVMNTEAELQKAFDDYQRGVLDQ